MSENFNEFLDSRVKELKNKKSDLKSEIEKAVDDNYKFNKKLEELRKNVKKRKKIHLILGFIGMIILNIITIKTIGILDINLSKLGIVVFSLIESIPLIVGIHNSGNALKEVEKEMNIELSKLDSEIDLNNFLINNNTKKLSKIDIILNEVSYLKQVSNIYESENIDKIIKTENSLEDKEKDIVKTLMPNKH